MGATKPGLKALGIEQRLKKGAYIVLKNKLRAIKLFTLLRLKDLEKTLYFPSS